MAHFYWELLIQSPWLLWESGVAVSGFIGVAVFFLLLFNRELANRITQSDGFSRLWSLGFLLLYFVYLLFHANYTRFVELDRQKGLEVAEAISERDKAGRLVEIKGAQIETLAIENAALAKGAPVLTGKEARIDEIRKQILKYADSAPSEEKFTEELGNAWMAGAVALSESIEVKQRDSATDFLDISVYEGTYKSLLRAVSSLRGVALNLRESDLLD